MVDIFSANVILALAEVQNEQNICKYLFYSQKNPLSQPNISDTSTLLFNNLFPYPFNPNINDTDKTQLHIYYGNGQFQAHEVMSDAKLIMDIIIPSAVYLVNDGEAAVRPYAIMELLIKHFSDKVIGSLGTVFFERFAHMNVNEKYDCVRLICDTKNIR